MCLYTGHVLLIDSCQGYHHTLTSTEHYCVKFLELMGKEKLFILMAPGNMGTC